MFSIAACISAWSVQLRGAEEEDSELCLSAALRSEGMSAGGGVLVLLGAAPSWAGSDPADGRIAGEETSSLWKQCI